VASTELSQYGLHHRDLSFAQTVEKAGIFHIIMDGGKAKKAVRFVGDVQQVAAAPQDSLPIINHLKGIEGRLDKMKSEKPPAQSWTSPSTSTQAPSVPPVPQQPAWRPRTGSHQNNTGPRYGPPASSASMLSAGSFQGPPRSFGPPRFSSTPSPPPSPSRCSSPSGFRQPGPRLAGRWGCGKHGCHSDFDNRMERDHVRMVHCHPVRVLEIVVGDEVLGCVATIWVSHRDRTTRIKIQISGRDLHLFRHLLVLRETGSVVRHRAAGLRPRSLAGSPVSQKTNSR